MTIVVEPASIPTPEIRLPKADKCVLVIFGATGDLTHRKLMPALYHLACLDCTTDEFHIVGVGRAPMGDEQFRDRMHEALRSAGAGALNERMACLRLTPALSGRQPDRFRHVSAHRRTP